MHSVGNVKPPVGDKGNPLRRKFVTSHRGNVCIWVYKSPVESIMLSCDAEGVARRGTEANFQSLAQECWAILNAGSTVELSEIAWWGRGGEGVKL